MTTFKNGAKLQKVQLAMLDTDVQTKFTGYDTSLAQKAQQSDLNTTNTNVTANTNAIGTLSQLNTSDKSSIVNALKEVKSQANANQTQVTALSNIAPKAVSLVANMTDQTKNYVYTGSEAGYTSGHWYFWNGTAWTDGGVYQATAIGIGAVAKQNLEQGLQNKILNQMANSVYMYSGTNHAADVFVSPNQLTFTTNTTYGSSGFTVPNANGKIYRFVTTIKNLGATDLTDVSRFIAYNNNPSVTGGVAVNGTFLSNNTTVKAGASVTYVDKYTSTNSTNTAISLQVQSKTNGAQLQITQNIYEVTNLDPSIDSQISWSTFNGYWMIADALNPGVIIPPNVVNYSNLGSSLSSKYFLQLVNNSYMQSGIDTTSIVLDDAQTAEYVTNTTYGSFGFNVPNVNGHVYKAIITVTNIGSIDAPNVQPLITYNNTNNGGVTANGTYINPAYTITVGNSQTFVTTFTSVQSAYNYIALSIFCSTSGVKLKVNQKVYDVTNLSADLINSLSLTNTPSYVLTADFANSVKTKWAGKTHTALGDSIMAQNHVLPKVQNALGFGTVNNLGVAGQAVATMADNLTSAIATSSDIITLYGCLNDFIPNGNPIGSVSDAPNKTGPTFISHLKYTIETVLNLAPNTPFVIIGTHNGADSYRPPLYGYVNGTDDIGNYVLAMGNVARHYGLPFIDMYAQSGFNAFSLSNYTVDGVHPNDAGADRIARVIARELNKLAPIS
jgi:lysophospholipase L1-like esterase